MIEYLLIIWHWPLTRSFETVREAAGAPAQDKTEGRQVSIRMEPSFWSVYLTLA